MIQKATFKTRTQDSPSLGDWPGVVVELQPAPEPVEAFVRLCSLPHCVFFDSALNEPTLGRYSFIVADPFEFFVASPEDASVWDKLQRRLDQFTAPRLADLPPFQGGLAGMFSYDLSRSLERLPRSRVDEFQLPGLAVGLYDVVVAFDHQTGRAWIISQGFPEHEPAARHRRAKRRAEEVRRVLERGERGASTAAKKLSHLITRSSVQSNFSRDEYLATVARAIEYIYAGDVFQVNLAQRLLHPATDDAVSLYLRLRERNPATFAGYFDLGEFQIVSASPERFLQVRDGHVEARPIKGTRPFIGDVEFDRRAADELLASEKDRAENVMIVDLLRNDLSKVCRPESVIVSELCRLERYAFVQHLVSVVQGELRDDAGPLDLLKGAFPGGSVTGAPKVRAMEIIAELEPTARGAYCGALGYIGFDGAMDASILIRTITAGRGWWQFPVGGGIVAGSDPAREYEETWAKAEGMLRALE